MDCIANSDSDRGPEVPLWECPCPTCTHMEWELQQSDGATPKQRLRDFRVENWPDHYKQAVGS